MSDKEANREELAKAVKDVLKDKESAKKFLLSAGIMDADGRLAEPYRTEEPASEDLEEEIRKYFLAYKGYPHIMDKTEREMKKACIYFAEWQKEQMMKDAVEGNITNAGGTFGYNVATFRFDDNHTFMVLLPPDEDAKYGDKVKMIIVKED